MGYIICSTGKSDLAAEQTINKPDNRTINDDKWVHIMRYYKVWRKCEYVSIYNTTLPPHQLTIR